MPDSSGVNQKPKNKKKGLKVGFNFDLKEPADLSVEAMALMLDREGKTVSETHFIFYNNRISPDGSVEHLGDIMIGPGDHQQIIVVPDLISSLVKRIIFFVNILNAEKKNQTFAGVDNLKIRFSSLETKQDIAEFIPEKDQTYRNSSLIVLAELLLVDEWQIAALGDNFRISLAEFIEILGGESGYDAFKAEYLRHFQERGNPGYSFRNIIEKDLEEKYFKILGCPPEADDNEIRKKYKELVKSFHPDMIQASKLHPEIIEFADKRFREIKEAYDFISKRRKLK